MPNDERFDLIGFGIAAVDEVVELPRFPQADSKLQVNSIRRYGGGQCTTALVAAARLGLTCGYAGLLGENELSDFTREYLEREGITVREWSCYPDARPYYAVILVDRSNGDRTILFTREGVRDPRPEDVPLDWLDRTGALLVDQLGPEGTLSACRAARERGVQIIADLERTDQPALLEIAELADHLILPLRVAREMTGRSVPAEVVAELARQSRRCTAVTWGGGRLLVRLRGRDTAPARLQSRCGGYNRLRRCVPRRLRSGYSQRTGGAGGHSFRLGHRGPEGHEGRRPGRDSGPPGRGAVSASAGRFALMEV